MTTPVLVYLHLQIAPSQPGQQLFHQACPAYQPHIFLQHYYNSISIVTTTPLDIVLQHTPAVTAHSGGTEQRSKENTLQPLPVFPAVANHSQIQQPIHSLPWTKPKQEAIPNATTNCSQDYSVDTQSSPIDTCKPVPQQQPT